LPQGANLDAIRGRRAAEIRVWLDEQLALYGLHAFVINILRPLCEAIGTAWADCEISVFEEHIFTAQAEAVLRAATSVLPAGQAPRILLATLPGERHGLVLLMLEALLAQQGASCIALSVETPPEDIARCAAAEAIDIVALSCSACYPPERAEENLRRLDAALASQVALWLGGAGAGRLTVPRRAVVMTELDDALKALAASG
jgi:methylmalonyl-CoA mutase cobalamin-binding subunit